MLRLQQVALAVTVAVLSILATHVEAISIPRSVGVPHLGEEVRRVDDLVSRNSDFWSIFVALRDLDGPRLVFSSGVTRISPAYSVGIGRASEVLWLDASSVGPVVDGDIVQFLEGPLYRRGTWKINLQDENPDVLLVREFEDGNLVLFDDVRLLTPNFGAFSNRIGSEAEISPRQSFRPAIAGAVDSLIFLFIIVIGGVFLSRSQMPLFLRISLAFAVGLSIQIIVGLLRLPSFYPLLVASAVAAVYWVVGRRTSLQAKCATGWTRREMGLLPFLFVATWTASSWVRSTGYIVFAHADNLQHLGIARAISEGRSENVCDLFSDCQN
jgi:hypothetical protein